MAKHARLFNSRIRANTPYHILIIVENLSVPADRRVWQEALALVAAGYSVSVICPKSREFPETYSELEGIHIHRHWMPQEARGILGYFIEYPVAIFLEFWLAIRIWKMHDFDALQACNPPDTIFIIGLFFRAFLGKKFVFDHHDINPELFEAKFNRRGIIYWTLRLLEKITFASAHVSLATNETLKNLAVSRGGMRPENVYVVRSFPDPKKYMRVEANTDLRGARSTLVGYLGIIGEQDGVDNLIMAMHEIVYHHGRNDIQCAIIGAGTALPALQALAVRKGLEAFISFPGYLTGESLLGALSAFDLAVIPDPPNSYNDKISMNKVFEYMALGIPFVHFDLSETRRVAGDAAILVKECAPSELAKAILKLTDDAELRKKLRAAGIERSCAEMRWEKEADNLVSAYKKILPEEIGPRGKHSLPRAAALPALTSTECEN